MYSFNQISCSMWIRVGKGESFNDNAGWEFQYDADEMNVKNTIRRVESTVKTQFRLWLRLLANSETPRQSGPFLSPTFSGPWSEWNK